MKKTVAIIIAVVLMLSMLPLSSAVFAANDTLYGDVNGDSLVNSKDVLTLRKYLASIAVSINAENSDVNCDGNVNSKDLLLIRKFLAGWSVVLGTTGTDTTGTTEPTEPTTEPTTDPTEPTNPDNLGGGGEVTEKPDVEDTSPIIKDIDGIDYSNSGVDLTETWDDNTATKIALSDSGTKISGSGAVLSGKVINITATGTYVVSGKASNQQIYVNVEGNVYLILNGVNLTCTDSAPIVITGKKKKVITVAKGTENTLTDAKSYSVFYNTANDEPNGAIFAKKALTINGTGKLTVNANYNNGISCKDVLRIINADVTVNAVNNAIKGNDGVILRSCKLDVTSQNVGIKSDAVDVGTGFVFYEATNAIISAAGDGISAVSHVYMVSGECNIKTGSNGAASSYLSTDTTSRKGIKCDNYLYVTDGTLTLDCYDDAIHCNDSVIIAGGTLNIKSGDDAVHADEVLEVTGGTVTAAKCYEGFEAAKISISGGNISITSSDDGINASDGSADSGPNIGPGGGFGGGDTSGIYFIMSGGTLYVNAQGDGLDSNGTITISGGDIKVDGPTGSNNGALDSNNGILMNGGTMIAAGSKGMVETPGSNSAQCCVSYTASSTLSAGTKIELRDASGNVLLGTTTAKTSQSVVMSHPSLAKGASYSIYINGSQSNTFTQSSTVTAVGSSSGGGFRPGK